MFNTQTYYKRTRLEACCEVECTKQTPLILQQFGNVHQINLLPCSLIEGRTTTNLLQNNTCNIYVIPPWLVGAP